jgi:peroxiredoxin Q/BCP
MDTQVGAVFKNHVTNLVAGMKAPYFELRDQDGKTRNLKEFAGKKLILYFYPTDGTPTCTEEACNLRDGYQDLQKADFAVLGISKDTESSHLKFSSKHRLPFSLLADTELKMSNAYGVWGLKKFMGKMYEGMARTTFLISEEGVITAVITKVKAKDHARQILELA